VEIDLTSSSDTNDDVFVNMTRGTSGAGVYDGLLHQQNQNFEQGKQLLRQIVMDCSK
jgi:hypothetical protein